eukprot:g404.t1
MAELTSSAELSKPLLNHANQDAQLHPSAPPVSEQPGALSVPMAEPLANEPWAVGHTNVYGGGLQGSGTLHAPSHPHATDAAWHARRKETLLEWGRKRERQLHRFPSCCMDQMLSGGTALFPPRLLDPEEWLTAGEREMLRRVEQLVAPAGGGTPFAMDMLAARIYDVNVKIILDNSGSMAGDMFGQFQQTHGQTDKPWIEWMSRTCRLQTPGNSFMQYQDFLSPEEAFAAMFRQPTGPCPCRNPCAGCCGPAGPCGPAYLTQPLRSAIDPRRRRWYFARDHLRKWMAVYRAMGLEPPVHLLNGMQGLGSRVQGPDVDRIFEQRPGGTTPLSAALLRVISEHQQECAAAAAARPLLLLVITDGEANNMLCFNAALDAVQNQYFGDVQCCLMGLSLVPEDIEWFENEECDDTRIRTVEAFEVEQCQMLRREVITREGDYNFAMHTYRTLVTNFFPADYDYEAPIQNMRHRCYITLHGRDRWWQHKSRGVDRTLALAQNSYSRNTVNPCLLGGPYFCLSWLVGAAVLTPIYLATGCCCCGIGQGNEFCKCRHTDCIDDMCADDE